MQTRADLWALLAGLTAATTGLAIWPVLSEHPTTTQKLVVSLGALASAICTLVPRVMKHGERAGAAAELAARYGRILGDLTDLRDVAVADYPDAALRAVTEFEAVKEKKDGLRAVGSREQIMAERHDRSQHTNAQLQRLRSEILESQGELRSLQQQLREEQERLESLHSPGSAAP